MSKKPTHHNLVGVCVILNLVLNWIFPLTSVLPGSTHQGNSLYVSNIIYVHVTFINISRKDLLRSLTITIRCLLTMQHSCLIEHFLIHYPFPLMLYFLVLVPQMLTFQGNGSVMAYLILLTTRYSCLTINIVRL